MENYEDLQKNDLTFILMISVGLIVQQNIRIIISIFSYWANSPPNPIEYYNIKTNFVIIVELITIVMICYYLFQLI